MTGAITKHKYSKFMLWLKGYKENYDSDYCTRYVKRINRPLGDIPSYVDINYIWYKEKAYGGIIIDVWYDFSKAEKWDMWSDYFTVKDYLCILNEKIKGLQEEEKDE